MNEKQARDAMNRKATVRAEDMDRGTSMRGTIIEVDGNEATIRSDRSSFTATFYLDEIEES